MSHQPTVGNTNNDDGKAANDSAELNPNADIFVPLNPNSGKPSVWGPNGEEVMKDLELVRIREKTKMLSYCPHHGKTPNNTCQICIWF